LRKRRPVEGVRCEPVKANESDTTDDASRGGLKMSKPRMHAASGQAWGMPGCCPDDIRRTGGASPVQAPTWNVRSCASILRRRMATVEVGRFARKRENPQAANPRGAEYRGEAQWRTVL
jgi:hypothetical protein